MSHPVCPVPVRARVLRCYHVASLDFVSVEEWYRYSLNDGCASYTGYKALYHCIFPSSVYTDHRPCEPVRHEGRPLRRVSLLGDSLPVLLLDPWSWHQQVCRRVVHGNASDRRRRRVSAGSVHDPKMIGQMRKLRLSSDAVEAAPDLDGVQSIGFG